MNDEEKYKYQRLYSRLKIMVNKLNKIDNSLSYLKDVLNENVLINDKALCIDQVNTSVSHIESIRNDMIYEIIPYVQDRTW